MNLNSNSIRPIHTSDFLNTGDNLFVISANNVLYTNDYGTNWNVMMDSLKPGSGCVDIDVFNDTLFLALYERGVYKHALPKAPVSLIEIDGFSTTVQIFPNPAHSTLRLAL